MTYTYPQQDAQAAFDAINQRNFQQQFINSYAQPQVPQSGPVLQTGYPQAQHESGLETFANVALGAFIGYMLGKWILEKPKQAGIFFGVIALVILILIVS